MNKNEAIRQAIVALSETGVTQFVVRRGEWYEVLPNDGSQRPGWKVVEMISKGNAHAYGVKSL